VLAEIKQDLIDVVVVYKVDRLTRSLTDFAKMVEAFDAHGVSFVSVTHQFNAITSMGRLTLNVLLSFAQFEREVTGERIRDKIAASKRKGIWMGGVVPLGYDVQERHLVINETEAAAVREIFRCYQELGSVRLLKEELDRRGLQSRSASRRMGCGQAAIRSTEAPSTPCLYRPDSPQGCLPPRRARSDHRVRGAARATKCAPSPLIGRLFDERGERLTPSHAVKGARRYRYYVSRKLIQRTGDQAHRGLRLPAAEIERIVAVAAGEMLEDQKAMLDAIQDMGIAANELPVILQSASSWSGRLRSEAETAPELSALVEPSSLARRASVSHSNCPFSSLKVRPQGIQRALLSRV
jgi:hypothetical protein